MKKSRKTEKQNSLKIEKKSKNVEKLKSGIVEK